MKKFLLSALCVVTSLLASAANEVVFKMPGGKTAPSSPWVESATNGPSITLTDATGTGSKAPEYYKNGSNNYTQYRFYEGNTLTISASTGYEITGISATSTATQMSATSVDVDQTTTSNASNAIELSSSAASVTLTFKQEIRFQSITVSYTEVSGGVKEPGEIMMNGKTLETTITVAPEAKIVFSCMNATSIVCSTNAEEVQSANTSTIEWIAPAADGQYTLTIIATGEEGSTPKTAEIAVTVETPIITGDVTFDFANNDYGMTRYTSGSSYNSNPTTINSENVTIVFDGGNNRLYTSDMRFYKNSHMTIFAPKGYILDSVALTGNSSDFTLDESSPGIYDSGTWTGESVTVKLNCTRTSGNAALTTILVSYAPASPALHIDGNALDATADGIDLEGATKKIHFEVAEGVSVWYKFVEATPATPAEVVRREAAADTDEDGFTLYTGSADNGIELSKAGTLHYYTAVNAIKGSVKTLTVHNTPTSISEITAEGAAARAIYDLQGRKVVAPAKGIFIVNGKKVRM